MLDQLVVTLVSLFLGSVLTMGVTYFSQHINNNSEKQKLIREKIEELYILSLQTKRWMQVQLLLACKLEEIIWHSDKPGWYVPDATIEPECPIDRIEMLVKLYVPSLKNAFATYRQSVLEARTLEGILKRKESKHALEALAASKYYGFSEDAYSADKEKKLELVTDLLRNLADTFDRYHDDFQEAVEKAVLKI